MGTGPDHLGTHGYRAGISLTAPVLRALSTQQQPLRSEAGRGHSANFIPGA